MHTFNPFTLKAFGLPEVVHKVRCAQPRFVVVIPMRGSRVMLKVHTIKEGVHTLESLGLFGAVYTKDGRCVRRVGVHNRVPMKAKVRPMDRYTSLMGLGNR